MSLALPVRLKTLPTAHAFALHLALSLILFSTLVAFMWLWWFPGELFVLDGGWQGLRLVALIDVVLGPALTLFLYKPGKPKLLLDMSLIATIQIAALVYGFATTYQQRTVAVVFAEGAFTTVSAAAAEQASHELRKRDHEPRDIAALDSGTPALLVTPRPEKGQYGKFLADLLNGYPEAHERSDLYVTIDQGRSDVEQRALDAKALETMQASQAVLEAKRKFGTDAGKLLPVRFKARYASGVALFDPNTNRIVDYVPVTSSASVKTDTAEAAN